MQIPKEIKTYPSIIKPLGMITETITKVNITIVGDFNI